MTRRTSSRHVWGVVVSIFILGAMAGGGWYLYQSIHPSSSPAPAIAENPTSRAESQPAAQTRWLPEGWDQKSDEEKIEFLKKEELAQAESLVREFSQNADALVVLGNVYRKYGNSAQALTCWEKALAINPKRTDAYDGMAMVAMEKGEHDRAAQLWSKALSLQPDTREFRCSMAQALSRGDHHPEAIGALEEEIRRYPASGLAYYLLGQEYMLMKAFDPAKTQYEKAIALMPEHTGSYYGLMTVCVRLHLTDEAQRYKKRFDELKSRDTVETRDLLRGQDDFKSLWTTSTETYLAAEALYRKTGDLRRAGAALRRVEEIQPDNLKLLALRAQDLRSQGRMPEALILHETIATRNPDDILNLFNLAGLYLEIKQFDKARAMLETAQKRSPAFDGAHRELARLMLIQGQDPRTARDLAARAVKLAPTAVNYYVYSWACDKSGDRAGAVAAIKQASELEPENPLYRDKYKLATMQD